MTEPDQPKKPRLKIWLDSYPNKNTRQAYQRAMKTFFRVKKKGVKGLPEIEQRVEEYLDAYQSKKKTEKDIQDDIQRFLKQTEDYAPYTRTTYLHAIKAFLEEHDIVLPIKFWKKLKRKNKDIKKPKPRTRDHIPTVVELRRLLWQMPIRARAMFRLQASTGCRLGEIMKLELDDLIFNHKELAPHILIREEITKTKESRIVFMTTEALSDLQRWLEKRAGQYPKTERRVFPFVVQNAYDLFDRARRRAELDMRDPRSNRFKLHPHCLRKFFRTRLGEKMPVDMVEVLLGHGDMITKAYRKYTEKQLSDAYKEAQDVLLVDAEQSVERLNGELKNTKDELSETKEKLNDVVIDQAVELSKLRRKLEEFESKMAELDIEATTERQHRAEYERGFYALLKLLVEKGVIDPPKSDSLEDYIEYWQQIKNITEVSGRKRVKKNE